MHIHSFPTEIVSRFLRHAIVGSVSDKPDPAGRRKVVQGVCLYWRDVVNSEPCLWSYIVIDNYTPLIELHSWLVKSGVVPLTFSLLVVDTNDVRRGLEPIANVREYIAWLSATIKPFLPRCEALRLCTSHEKDSILLLGMLRCSPMPLLTFLDLDVVPPSMAVQRLPRSSVGRRLLPPLLPQNLSQLEQAVFTISLPLWTWAGVLASLTDVSFRRMWSHHMPSMDEMHAFFAAAPRLVRLQLYLVECGPSSVLPSRVVRPTLPALTHLDLAILSTSSVALVASLHLPQVRTLRLELWDSTDISALVNQCRPLLASITSAVLFPHVATFRQVADLLYSMPCLVRLDGRGGLSFFSKAFQGLSLHWTELCPELSAVILPPRCDYYIIDDILRRPDLGNFSDSLSLYLAYPANPGDSDCVLTSFYLDSSSISVLRRPVDSLLDYYTLPILPVPVSSS
ncbi:hypothetical protein C8R46DRAFT_1088012 [Mycena filopes]|nr:hypothetical protein C8R46DRAFT_1088012 [Mycena filopes]